ncbi:MAG: WG repeat-containing protein [Psychrobacter sp.]
MSIKKRFIEFFYLNFPSFLKLFANRYYKERAKPRIQQPIIHKFNDDFRIVRHMGKHSLLDNKENIFLCLPYDDIMLPQEGLALVFNIDSDKLYNSDDDDCESFGFIDEKGKLVIPMIYSCGDDFSGGLAVVKKNGKWGFIDSLGKTIIAFKYEDAMSFEEDLAAVQLEGKWGFIDKQGQMIIEPKLKLIAST